MQYLVLSFNPFQTLDARYNAQIFFFQFSAIIFFKNWMNAQVDKQFPLERKKRTIFDNDGIGVSTLFL